MEATSSPFSPVHPTPVNEQQGQRFHCFLSLGTSDKYPNGLLVSHWPACADQRDAGLTVSSQLATATCSSVFSEPPSFTS